MSRAEGLGKHRPAAVEVGDVVGDVVAFQPVAQAEGEHSLARGGVIAVDKHGMGLGEEAQVCLDGAAVQAVGALPHLIDLAVARHVVATDGEGDDHADVARLAKLGKAPHLMGVERTEDDVAAGCGRVGGKLLDVVVDGDVPGMHVDVQAGTLQAVAGHEKTAVVFRHAAPVAVDVVQGKHDAHVHGAEPMLL